MKLAKHQAGMGFIGWLSTLVVVGLFGVMFLKLLPLYIEYFNIRSVLNSFKNEAAHAYSGPEQIRDAISKRFRINDVNTVRPTEVLIVPRGNGYSLEVEYEKRVPFIFNVSLIVNFSEKSEVRGSGGIPQ